MNQSQMMQTMYFVTFSAGGQSSLKKKLKECQLSGSVMSLCAMREKAELKGQEETSKKQQKKMDIDKDNDWMSKTDRESERERHASTNYPKSHEILSMQSKYGYAY